MIPILYEYNVTAAVDEGLGRLADATRCTVQWEQNGLYELEMNYQINSPMFPLIQTNRLIGAFPYCGIGTPQLFEIYDIRTPAEGSITVRARHISYRLLGQVVMPFTAKNAAEALQKLQDNLVSATAQTGFTISYQLGEGYSIPTGDFELSDPTAARTVLCQIADQYGGNLWYDGLNVTLQFGCSVNRGAAVRYGKNMRTMSYNIDIGDMYTHVLAYYHRDPEYEDEPYTALDAYAVYEMVSGVPVEKQRTMIADVSQAIDDQAEERDMPDEPDLSPENLRRMAAEFIENNKDVISTPVISTEVTHIEIGDQAVMPGDYVTVTHPNFTGDIGAIVTKTVWDVLGEQYESVTLGEPAGSIDSALACILSWLPRHSDDWYNLGPRLGTGTTVVKGDGGDGYTHWLGTAREYDRLESYDEKTVYMIYSYELDDDETIAPDDSVEYSYTITYAEASGYTITNPTEIDSAPIITVDIEGNGPLAAHIAINSGSVGAYSIILNGITGEVVMDCGAGTISGNYQSMSMFIWDGSSWILTQDYPVLSAGTTTISTNSVKSSNEFTVTISGVWTS